MLNSNSNIYWHNTAVNIIHNAVKCHYDLDMVQFIMILPPALWWQQQNIYQTSKSQQTPHTLPSLASYGVSFARIRDKIDRVIMASHCKNISHLYLIHVHANKELELELCSDLNVLNANYNISWFHWHNTAVPEVLTSCWCHYKLQWIYIDNHPILINQIDGVPIKDTTTAKLLCLWCGRWRTKHAILRWQKLSIKQGKLEKNMENIIYKNNTVRYCFHTVNITSYCTQHYVQ